jgi:hypothetical protein
VEDEEEIKTAPTLKEEEEEKPTEKSAQYIYPMA